MTESTTPAEQSQRALILGCGYVGSALAQTLARAGCDVTATTTREENVDRVRALGATPAVVTLTETDRLHDLLHDRAVVYLCVAAGRGGQSYRQVYLEGAQSLLHAIRGTSVARIVYTSSTRVYAQDDGSRVDEDSDTRPSDENGRILVETERVLLGAGSQAADSGQIAVTVLRLGGIHGPGRELSGRIHAAAGTTRNDGGAFVNLIHRDDIVAAMVTLGRIHHHGVLNLVSDEPILRRELYDRILADAGLAPIEWQASDGDARQGKRVRNDLLKRTLGVSLRSRL